MSSVCHIVCAGPAAEPSNLGLKSGLCDRGQTPVTFPVTLGAVVCPGDFIIAVDGGFAYCLDAGLAPDLFVGDLDSLAPELASRIACERIELPCEKDDTDTLFACKEGLRRGYTEFVLHCALGGDVGHEIANMQTLAFLHERGARGELRGDTQSVFLITPEDGLRGFTAPIGTRVSVFAFGSDAHGVTEHGLQWELEDAVLASALPIGVSNCSAAETFEIGVKDGMLLVVIDAAE